jgi:hypothetical protein
MKKFVIFLIVLLTGCCLYTVFSDNKDDSDLYLDLSQIDSGFGDSSILYQPYQPYQPYSYSPYIGQSIVLAPDFSVEVCSKPLVGKNCLIEVRGVAFDEANTICAYNFNKSTGEIFVLECREPDVDQVGDKVALFKMKFKEKEKHHLVFILGVGDFPLALRNVVINVN